MERLLFPYFIERSTNVPKHIMESFSNEKLPEYVKKVEQARINLDAVALESTNVLEKQFALHQNNKILNYKRKVFNHKYIREIDDQLDLISFRAVEKYKEAYQNLIDQQTQYEEAYQSTYEENRKLLHIFYRTNKEIPKAFSLINKEFDHKFKKYIETPVEGHNVDIRKMDHQLIRLLSRATMKTSPFSYLTSICLSNNCDSPDADKERESICEINNYIIKLIYDYLVIRPTFAVQCNYRISAHRKYEDSYVFLGQQDYEKGKVYKTVDWSKKIVRNQLLDMIIDRFGYTSFPYNELENYIRNAGLPDEKIRPYILDMLLKNRIITNSYIIDETKGDIFEEFYRKVGYLKDDDTGILERILGKVKHLEQCLREFSTAGWEERFLLIHNIDQCIKDLSKEIGKEFVHEILLYEDTIYRNMKKAADIDEHFLDNLTQLQKYSKIFDQSYPVLLLFSDMFREKYGEEEVRADDLDVYQLFVKSGSEMSEVWKDTLTDCQNCSNEKMKRIYEMKCRFKDFLQEAKNSCDSVSIKEFIDHEIECHGDLISEDENSSTVFFQKAADRYIINKIYNGKLIFFSRFVKLFNEVTESEEYQTYIDKVFGTNSVEISECFGFNANVHIPVTSKRLVLPLTDVNDPLKGDLQLRDCYFKYCEKESRVKLYHDSLGEISVVYLGSLAYYLLPTIMKTLLGLNPSTRFDPSYMNFWKNEACEGLVTDSIPEIVYDNMVLIRKQYLINNVFDMTRQAAELYKDIICEFENYGLPTRFFIKAYMNKPGFEYLNMGRTQLKPQYIDLTNTLLFKEFCAKLEKEGQLIVEELMPYNQEDDYIHEYQVEYSTVKAQLGIGQA